MSLYDPRNRKEIYYRGILDGDNSLPDPQTREEIFLKAIAEAMPIITEATVKQTTGSSATDVMSQDAVTKRLLIYKSGLSSVNILEDVFDVGLYTIAPVGTSNITGYPDGYDITGYSFLLVFHTNIRILCMNETNDMWIRTASASVRWQKINPDSSIYADIISRSYDAGMGLSGTVVTGTDTAGSLIPSTGANAGKPQTYSDTNYHTVEYDIKPNSVYLINCGSRYSNCYYSIQDYLGNVITYQAHSGSTYDEITKVIYTSDRSSKLYLAYVSTAGSASLYENLFFSVPEFKEWTGKKWTVLGDSLTEVNSRTTMHYHDYIKDKTGISVVNMGLSGSGYAKKADTNQAFYQRAADIPTDSDVVTIFGSGNDLSSGLSLGDPSDTGTTTICGCINETLDVILTTFMTASKVPFLGVITPTPWIGHDPGDNTDTMTAYCDAIIECCKAKSIPVLDLYRCSNLHPNDATFRSLAYSHDEGNGVHPDETGHKLIAGAIENFIKSIILSI